MFLLLLFYYCLILYKLRSDSLILNEDDDVSRTTFLVCRHTQTDECVEITTFRILAIAVGNNNNNKCDRMIWTTRYVPACL